MSVSVRLENVEEKERVRLLYNDITHLSQTQQLLACSGALFAFFVLYGYMQELIFTIDGFKSYGWYLTLTQFGCYTVFALVERVVADNVKRKMPIKTYLLLALLTLGTIGFSNASLGYLNYPTQVVFKCCKLIPVMAGGIFIQRKRYGPLDFVAASLMCLGLIVFTLADTLVLPSFNLTGVLMISMALLCDAVIGNVQEKSMKSSGASNIEVVLYSYSIGFVYLLIVMTYTGDLFDGLVFYSKNPQKTYGYTFIFSLTGYLGIQIVLTLVRTCGAFVAVSVTTCRKAVTIIISFIFFAKPFSLGYIAGGILVVIGIYLNVYSKRHPFTFSDAKYMASLYLRRSNSRTRKQGQYLSV